MREHLFRAKRKDTKQWVFGSLVNMPTSTFIIPKTEKVQLPDFIEVDPSTVGKFTNRYCQGNPIYEGDILYEDCPESYKIVYYDEKATEYRVKYTDRDQTFAFCGLSDRALQLYNTIVGNIFDNYELLKF